MTIEDDKKKKGEKHHHKKVSNENEVTAVTQVLSQIRRAHFEHTPCLIFDITKLMTEKGLPIKSTLVR